MVVSDPSSIYFFRLVSNLSYSKSSCLFTSEIYDKFKLDTGIDTNCQHVSRNVVKIFPNIVSKYTQNVLSGGSEKQFNVSWKEKDNTLINPLTFHIPESWSVVQRSKDTLILNMMSNIVMNKVNVVKTISIRKTSWGFSVFQQEICPSAIGLASYNDWTLDRVMSILHISQQLKVCKGKEFPPNSKAIGKVKVEEICVSGDENMMPQFCAMSSKCSHLLPISNLSQMCRSCNSLKFKRSLSTEDASGRNQDKKEMLSLEESDCDDISKIMEILVNSDIDESIKKLIKSQLTASSSSPTSRRWDPDIISMSLALYCRSPKAYQEVVDGGMILLPSGRLLRYYKNCCEQSPGFQVCCTCSSGPP